MPETQLVVFELVGELCAADISQVCEIVKYQQITKVPEMPEFIEGVVNLRGKVVSVINLSERFCLGRQETNEETKIVVTQVEDQFIGFRVLNVNEVATIPDKDIETSHDLIKSIGGKNYIKGIAKRGEQLITLVDLHAVLDQQELKEVEEDKGKD